MFFVSYINRNHKDTRHPWGKRLDTTLYIDQNVGQPGYLKDLEFFSPKNRLSVEVFGGASDLWGI